MLKFEKLDCWNLAVDYIELVYQASDSFPPRENYGVTSQLRRAAVSVALNVAEGSHGQTDKEQARFLGMAIRSYIETVAVLVLAKRLNMIPEESYANLRTESARLLRLITAFRNHLDPTKSSRR